MFVCKYKQQVGWQTTTTLVGQHLQSENAFKLDILYVGGRRHHKYFSLLKCKTTKI